MRAAVLIAPTSIEIRDIARPVVPAGGVLIEPVRFGICGSDVTFFKGQRTVPYPFVLGHELVGRVVELGDGVSKFEIGQRVIVEPNYPCGGCNFCYSGRGSICPNKQSMGVTVPGCFAEYATAPAEFVWPVPASISDEDAAAIEPMTVSLHAFLASGARIGDTVAVVGCGVIGLLLIHIASRLGVRVLAHDRIEGKLALARKLGAETPGAEDVANLWLAENVTAIYECGGSTGTTELSISAAPRGSRVLILGLSTTPASFVPLRLVREGIRIEPSLIYDHPADFARAIRLVESGILKPSCVVSETFPFDSMGRALELACTGQSAKIQAVI